jgi:hypothetical protein
MTVHFASRISIAATALTALLLTWLTPLSLTVA